jgi:hypothetical protein
MKEQLLDILQSIEKPGSFCTSDEIPPCFLDLDVKNVGTIGLPLGQSQAKEIIAQCHQAPYGKGTETIVDTDVRKVWELNPDQFEIGNADWQRILKDICQQVKTDLGVATDIYSEIYKLLIYETGSFFLPHRDTEKMDGMFATLIVVLPSKHEGGELIIRHDGEEECFAFGGEEANHKIRFAAFYADCEHEVKPVTDGYRLCLVYNLALKQKDYPQLFAPKHSDIVEQLAETLREIKIPDDENKLVILLDHQYTEAELSFNTLKNKDRVQAQLLMKAAEKAGYKAYLALVTLWECGAWEDEEYDDYSYRRGRHKSVPQSETEYEMGEIYDSSLTVNNWVDSGGNKQNFGEMRVRELEIIATEDIRDRDADRAEYEGYTGNAGCTLDHWYYRAAIVLWKNEQNFSILAHDNQNSAVPGLQEMLAKNPTDLSECKKFAKIIFEKWDTDSYDENCPQQMLEILIQLDDENLTHRFINEILTKNFFGKEGAELRRLCEKYGWASFEYALTTLSNQSERNKITGFAVILEKLTEGEIQEDQRVLCIILAENVLHNFADYSFPKSYNTLKLNEKMTFVISIFKVFCYLQQPELLKKLGLLLNGNNAKFDLHVLRIPLVKELHDWLDSESVTSSEFVSAFFTPVFEEIKHLATMLIEPPKDWQREAALDCKCEYCQDFSTFLQSPTETEFSLKKREEFRVHIEDQVKKYKIDVDCKTETRKGSPYTLICNKNQATYERTKTKQAEDMKLFENLKRISQ